MRGADVNIFVTGKNNTVRAKRLIGKKFSDPVVQDDILLWSFKVTAGDNGVDIIDSLFDFSSSINRVSQCTKDKELCKGINPDEVVAYGAAVQAALLSEGIQNVPKLVLKFNETLCIPVNKTKAYITTKDNQTISSIHVYGGERTRASDNNLLGSFILSGIPPAPRVSAKNIASGSSNKITITNHKERLSSEDIKKLIQEAENYCIEDKKFLRKAKPWNALDDYIYKIRNALKKEDINLKLSSEEIEKIESAIAVATNLVDQKNQQVEIDVLEDHVKELQSWMKQIIAKTT
ncbi:DnaK family protein [Medicago truncatula]|uniref:DnaK family protein n=1 Tax=Medicago truncatula TaxID=3880 RepID=G7IAX1_MEDTR|nr:DnaK family protein [Medicago truncatula]